MDSSADGGHPFAEYTDRQLRKWLIQHGGLPRGVGYRAGLVKVAMERLNSGDGAGKEVPVAVTPQQSRRSKPDHRANTEYLARTQRWQHQRLKLSITPLVQGPRSKSRVTPQTAQIALPPLTSVDLFTTGIHRLPLDRPGTCTSRRGQRKPNDLCFPGGEMDTELPVRLSRLREHLRHHGRLCPSAVQLLLSSTQRMLSTLPNVLRIEASDTKPLVVCGDIHGQYYDLLHMLENVSGEPQAGTRYLFLGDYVDRGRCSTEVALTLFAMVLCFPDRVWLLRGNHESCNSVEMRSWGFRDECIQKYGEHIYEQFLRCFEAMPIAAVLEATERRRAILCVHGGIGKNITSVSDIESIDRFHPISTNAPITDLCDLTWSDPMECSYFLANSPDEGPSQGCPGEVYTQQDYRRQRLHFRPNDRRNTANYYSLHAVDFFLDTNNLMCLIRAHMLSPDMKDNGFKLHYSCSRKPDHKAEPSGTVDLNGSCVPSVITIFSAPDYVYVSPQPSRESVEKMSTIGSVREIVPVASGYPVPCSLNNSRRVSQYCRPRNPSSQRPKENTADDSELPRRRLFLEDT